MVPWYKLIYCTFWSVFGMNHKKHVWESSSKICTISMMMSGAFRCVNIHTLWTITFYHGFSRHITQSQWKHRLCLTVDSWTVTKIASLIFFNHLGNSSICENVASMNKSIQHFCCLLYEIRLVWIIIQILI